MRKERVRGRLDDIHFPRSIRSHDDVRREDVLVLSFGKMKSISIGRWRYSQDTAGDDGGIVLHCESLHERILLICPPRRVGNEKTCCKTRMSEHQLTDFKYIP